MRRSPRPVAPRSQRCLVVDRRMTVEVMQLSVSDVARGARELVEAEALSTREWAAATEPQREDVRCIVRAALLRLLDNPAWLPGSVRMSAGRIDVRLTIELDSDIEHQAARSRAELRRQRVETRHRLLALAEQLQDDDVGESDG